MTLRRYVALIGVASLILIVMGGPAPAQSTPPPELEEWPACAGATGTESPSPGRDDYCIRQFLVDGVSRLSDIYRYPVEGKYYFFADILAPGVVRWAVNVWENERLASPPDADYSVTLDLGAIEPLYTDGLARDGNVVTSGDAQTGYEITMTGRTAKQQWKIGPAGEDCMVVPCEGIDQANTAGRAFSGYTQDMRKWVAEEREEWKNTWRLSEVQYIDTPVFSQETRLITDADGNQVHVTVPYWSIDLANPHLEVDGDPFVGGFTTYLTAEVLARMNTSAEEAAAAGFEITWLENGNEMTIAATIVATSDGGVIIDMPAVPFSSPTIKVSEVVDGEEAPGQTSSPQPSASPTTGPDPGNELEELAPLGVKATPLDGGAVVTFARPISNGGSRITGYTVQCSSGDLRATAQAPKPVAVELTVLTNGLTWMCRVRATNLAGYFGSSPEIEVRPTEGLPPIPPGVTHQISHRVTRVGAVRLAWAQPLSTGGAPITRYRVALCPRRSGCDGSGVIRKRTGERQIRIPARDLRPIRYRVLVRAVNEVGAGAAARVRVRVPV